MIEVWDPDSRPPILREAADADEAGRGLVIVEALCRRWGYFYPESSGKTVWGELTAPDYPETGDIEGAA
jgi:hypothetical protein